MSYNSAINCIDKMIEDKKNLFKSEIDKLYELRCFILTGAAYADAAAAAVAVVDAADAAAAHAGDAAAHAGDAAAHAGDAAKKTNELACGYNWADACDDEMDEIKNSPPKSPKSYVKATAEFGAHEGEFQTVPVTYARAVPTLRASPAKSSPASPAKSNLSPGKIVCKINSKLDGKSMKQFLVEVAKQRSSVTKNMDGVGASLLGTADKDIYVLANSDGNTDINGEIGWTSRYYGNMLDSVHDAVASIDDKGTHDLIVVYAQKNPEGSYHKEQITVSLYMRRY